MHWRGRAATLAVLAATALAFVLALPSFKFSTKITEFLPDDSANRGAQIAAMLAESEVAKVMIVDLSGPAPEPLATLATELVTFLGKQADVAVARSGFTEDEVTALLAFLGEWPPTTFLPRSAYTDEHLRARLANLVEELGGPKGVLIRQTAPRDPLGGMWEPLEALRAARGSALVDVDGVVMTADRTHAFIFLETRSSPFDSEAQRAFRATLDGWLKTAPPGTRMQTAGTAQFAIASEALIKHDVNRIGIISTIGIVLMFLVLFGSPRMIFIGLVPMVFGSAVAVLACQRIYGEIHGITIAFGTSLLGVGLDYVEHYYTHFALNPKVPAKTTMRHVAPSLVLGALTTIIGFIGLGGSGLPGLRQMAVFSVIAIVASMVATCLIVPPWMPARYRPPATLARLDRLALRLLDRITRRPWTRAARWTAAGVATGATVLALLTATFSDDVNMLVDDHGPHVADDRQVRDRLGPDSDSFAVVTADTDEALLTAIGKAGAELERARAAGTLAAYVPLDRLVPSREEQLARFAAAREAVPRIRQIMDETELVAEQFQPLWDALAAPAPKVLALDAIRRSPLAPLLATWLPNQTSPIALIPLFGVKDRAALRAAVPSATIIAPRETIVELFAGVRGRTVVAAGIGAAAIFLLLLARYRSARKVVVALAPALLACIATVGTLVVIGEALTILHVMAMLLVVSLGVDFGIFFVDTAATAEEAARTMVSILTASITSILSFGLLCVSASPGLAALGITVTLGVSYSVVACWLMAWMSGRRIAPGAAA